MSLRVAILAVVLAATNANAWVFSEHRDISVAAVLKLDSERRHQLDAMWRMARVGHENRLTTSFVISEQPERPAYLDWATWPALGGDHSCSSATMLQAILHDDWVLEVAGVAERFKRKVMSTTRESQRLNALRDQDLQLQRADRMYVTRASSNTVHFMHALPSIETSKDVYIDGCLAQGAETNAYSAYAWYHYRAIVKASRIREAGLTDEERRSLAIAALADEAFAVHFLEDVFAAGHVTGTWGSASLRKGTHDYYNEHGYVTRAWDGTPLVLLGDANLNEKGLETPTNAVAVSLAQIADAFAGRIQLSGHVIAPDGIEGLGLLSADTLDVCRNSVVPGLVASRDLDDQLLAVIDRTPVPALKSGIGEMPRFRSELGGFFGLAPHVSTSGWHDDFHPAAATPLGIGSVGVGIRMGLGLDGVMSDAGDGLTFIEFGLTNDSPSSSSYAQDQDPTTNDDDVATIPARTSISARMRMPFYLVPGDLLLGALFIAPFSPDTYLQMAAVASNGGLFPWQSGVATPIGRFQFMLGRELGIRLYGFLGNRQSIYVPVRNDRNDIISEKFDVRSIVIEAPIAEWRPYRMFSFDQHSSLCVQVCATTDIPLSWSSDRTPAPVVELRPRYGVSMRVVFDWRYYY